VKAQKRMSKIGKQWETWRYDCWFKCRAGLRLADDGHSCEDVDECAESSAGCEQVCENKDPRTDGEPFLADSSMGSLSREDAWVVDGWYWY
jgi:hypothetical protein